MRSPIVMLFFAVFLSVAAHARNGIFADETSLWSDNVRKAPWNAMAWNGLGRARQYEKKLPLLVAEAAYLKALDISPFYAQPYVNLGYIYYKRGEYGRAAEAFEKAIAFSPVPFEDHHRFLGYVYLKKGMRPEAMAEFGVAIGLLPKDAVAKRMAAATYSSEGFKFSDSGDFEGALILHRIAAGIKPDYANASYGIALALEGLGRKEESAGYWREYLILAPQGDEFRQEATRRLERLSKER
ncbi:MAG: tetratricopeptide repeat protein [Thermodesulfobacteriota bacterium]